VPSIENHDFTRLRRSNRNCRVQPPDRAPANFDMDRFESAAPVIHQRQKPFALPVDQHRRKNLADFFQTIRRDEIGVFAFRPVVTGFSAIRPRRQIITFIRRPQLETNLIPSNRAAFFGTCLQLYSDDDLFCVAIIPSTSKRPLFVRLAAK